MATTYPLVDRILDGKLAERLRQARSDGLSYQRIADDLRDDYGVRISSETIRRWCADPEPTA